MVLGDGMRLAGFGTAIGVLTAMTSFRFLHSLLVEVQVIDSRMAIVGVGALAATMLGACYIPASRASGLNPVDALRSD